jgi:DNA-binding XRE family transcriptional regulator
MNGSPAERLRAAREKRYATAKDAATAHGWNEVTYRSHENGIRNFPLSAARKYAKAFGVSPSYLLGIAVNGEAHAAPVNSVINVPLVARASAGAFRVDEGLDVDGVLVPAVPHPTVPAAVQYAVLIDGPSVNRRIADGAFAICAPFDKFPGGPAHGQLVHVVRERAGLHEHTIKEIRYTAKGAILMPCSTDPRYQEQITIASAEDDTNVRIAGVVIGAYQPF